MNRRSTDVVVLLCLLWQNWISVWVTIERKTWFKLITDSYTWKWSLCWLPRFGGHAGESFEKRRLPCQRYATRIKILGSVSMVRKLESEKSDLTRFGFTWGMVAKAKTHVLQHWRRNMKTTGWVKGTDWSTVFLSDFGTEIWAWLDVLNFWCLRCSSSEIKMEFSKNGIVAKRYNWHCAQFYQLSRWKLQFPITPHATITVACLDSDVHISLCKKSKQTKNTSEVSQHITNKFQNNHTIHHLTVPTFVFAQQKIHCQVVAQAFRNGEIQLLVTTDVMGRGLDIPGISHVGGLSELPKISQKNMGEE